MYWVLFYESKFYALYIYLPSKRLTFTELMSISSHKTWYHLYQTFEIIFCMARPAFCWFWSDPNFKLNLHSCSDVDEIAQSLLFRNMIVSQRVVNELQYLYLVKNICPFVGNRSSIPTLNDDQRDLCEGQLKYSECYKVLSTTTCKDQ